MFEFVKDWGGTEWGVIVAAMGVIVAVFVPVYLHKKPPADSEPEPVSRVDWPKFDNIPARPRDIQGRGKAIKALKRQIETSPVALTGGRQNIVAARGAGGIGKSELANEFARHYKQNYEGVWIVRAESETTLHNDLAFLGAQIQCNDDLPPREKALAALQAIKDRGEYWLIIYDNVTDQAAIKDYLTSGDKLHYLITTRSSLWAGINSYPVGLLENDEALKLLRQVSGRDDKDLDKIVEKLEGYPLALVVAGAYLKNHHGATVKSYLETFEQRLNDLYAADYDPTRDPDIKAEYPRSILGSLSLTIDQLSGDAKDLLSLASCLSPDDIWLELIETGAKDTDDDGAHPWPNFIDRINSSPGCLNTALTELKVASLTEAKDDRITMHRLTQDVRRAGLKAEGEIWADTAIRMVNAVTPYDTAAPANWSRLDRLTPHVERLLANVPDSSAADRATGQIGSYLRRRGHYAQAVTLQERRLEISAQVNGKTSPLHAVALNNLAGAYEDNEQIQEAEACYLLALKIVRGGVILNNLGLLYKNMNKYDDAEPLYLEAQELTKTTLGENHPDFASDLANLAALYQARLAQKSLDDDKLALILKYEEQARDITTAAHGHWHQDTATYLNNLAITFAGEGENEKAIDVMRRAAATRLDVLGQEHQDTQTSLSLWVRMMIRSVTDESQIKAIMESIPEQIGQKIAALRADHVKWGTAKIGELQARYDVEDAGALRKAVKAESDRLKKEGAPLEKYEWVNSEFRGAVFALKKGVEWGLIDPETGEAS